VKTRNDLHEELDLMFQVETQKMKAERRISQEGMELQTPHRTEECRIVGCGAV
jgi:hypothetical protein